MVPLVSRRLWLVLVCEPLTRGGGLSEGCRVGLATREMTTC